MSVLDRSLLEQSTLADLHAIAAELSIEHYRRLRKAELVDAIISSQGGDEAPAERPSGRGRQRQRRGAPATEVAAEETETQETAPADAGEPEDETGSSARRRRGRRGGRSRTAGRGEADGERRADGHRDDEDGRQERRSQTETAVEPEIVEGTVELLPNGSGFVRVSPPEPSDADVYVSAAQVKRCELVNGDHVSGPRRAPHRSERFASLVRIDTVNGRPAAEVADKGRFDDLPAAFPSERFELDPSDPTLKALGVIAPFGRGSRVVISGGAWAGKSHLLRLLAQQLAATEGVSVLVALAGVRPEELGEWTEGPLSPAAAVSFAASAEAQDNAVEMVVDQAKRLAARGAHAVVLIDTLDGLHPLNARRALAAARCLRDGGSLTVIATSSRPLGGETTVIALDAAAAMAGRHPAVDVATSGTMRPELLVSAAAVKAMAKERAKALR